MNAWIKKKWTRLKGWFIGLLVALGVIAGGVVIANDDVNISWENPTEYVNGDPLPIEELRETILYKQTFPLGTDITAVPRNWTELVRVPSPGNTYVDANQPDGIHCYTGRAVSVLGAISDEMTEACKTIDSRVPLPGSNLTVN